VGQVTDLYISADIESDGPIPGEFSMLSFGFAVAGSFDGESFSPEPDRATFYRELQPISERFDPDALRVSGLDRNRLATEGAPPAAAMADAAAWVDEQASGDRRPVMVAYPAVFDWMFLHWYFVRFCGSSPFGFSGAIEMKTMYHRGAGVTLDRAGRDDLPPELLPDRPHTHDALADAIEQAEIFIRLW